MAIGNDTSLLFRIKGDATDAIRALNQTQREAGQLTGATTGLSSGLAALAGPAAIAATVIAGIGLAAVAVTSKLFDLAKGASDFASSIKDAADKTGASTDALQALKVAAEQSGSSFDNVQNAVAKFNVLIGNAAAGNEKAEATLKQYGITAKDTDTALVQAVSTIASMTSSTEQASAAQALFKDRTGEILPVIKSFNGDLPGLIAKLKSLGVIMGEDDVKAGDEFGDQMDLLNKQLAVVGHTIGFAVMPVFLKFATELSNWLSKNQGEIKFWATVVGDAFELARTGLLRLYDDGRRAFGVMRAIAALTTQGQFGPGAALAILQQTEADVLASQESRSQRVAQEGGGRITTGGVSPGDTSPTGTPSKVNTIQIDQARSTQAEIAKAQLESFTNTLDREFKLWDAQQQTILARFKADLAIKAISEKEFQTQLRTYEDERLAGQLANLELERNKRKELGFSILEIENDIKIKREEIDREMQERREKDANRKREDEQKELEHLEKKYESWKRHIEQLQQADELAERQAARQREEDRAKFEGESGLGSLAEGIFGELGGLSPVSIFGDQDVLLDEAEFIKNVWTDLEGHIGGAIGSMVDGLAQMAAAWLATGKFSAEAALQMAASVALSLAMQAGVAAIMELAKGWAESAAAAASAAVFDFYGAAMHTKAAALHFAAAAVYGTVAGAAAVAGVGFGLAARAAGGGSGSSARGSFQQQTGGQQERNIAGQGQAYSGYGDKAYIQEEGRNAPLGVDVRIKFEDKPAWFTQMFVSEWRANGRIRRLVEDGR